jgi:uncharacterized protein (DUF305 family)
MSRSSLGLGCLVALLAISFSVSHLLASQQMGTPAATPWNANCALPASPVSATSDHSMDGMHMTTPVMSMDMDLAYIDMMIPHHASIIALATVALPYLQDKRLRTMAQQIVTAQTEEIDELEGYRLNFYGSADPQPVDTHAMMQMTGDSSLPMDTMMMEMDPTAQVAAFCAASDPDLASIDLTIPHHESAVITSTIVVEQAVHPEIRDFAQRVIEAQQREIEELTQIREELSASATPDAKSS